MKSGGEPALKSIQEEVKRRREDPAIIEDSLVGDSQSTGVAERAVRAVAEQVRVLRHALESRLGLKLNSMHPVLCWLVEHAADLLTKYQVSSDGKTGYERWKGKKYNREMIEFGEKVHYKENAKRDKNHKLEARWARFSSWACDGEPERQPLVLPTALFGHLLFDESVVIGGGMVKA